MPVKSVNVLLVEEPGQFRTVFVKMLRRAGLHVLSEEYTEKEALEIVHRSPVEAVLCNWDFPEKRGLDLLRRLRANPVTENLPFLLVNEAIDEGANALANEFEADGQLITPLSQNMVENMIQAVLKRRADSTEEVVRLARAGAFVDVGAEAEAEEEIESAQKVAPESPRVWTKSGALFEGMEKNKRAKSCYGEAVSIDENYTQAYDHMAGLLQKEGDNDGAIRVIEQAAQLSPRNPDRHVRLAKVHLLEGHIDEAKRAVETAAALAGEENVEEGMVAEFFMENGRADLAEDEFVSVLENDPTNIHIFNRLGISLRHQKKYDESVQNYHKAISIAPDDEVLHYNMALVLYANKDTYLAQASLRRALQINPEFKEAQKILERIGG